jgi:hypothetical protein
MIGLAGLFSPRAGAAGESTAGTDLRATQLGASLHPQTAAEITAGVTPVNYLHASGPRRYGAVGDNVADDTTPWTATGRVNGYHFVADGYYLLHSKVQIAGYVTIVGATRQSTWLVSGSSTDDFVVEIGTRSSGPNPNVGALERLRFGGNRGNKACLHLQSASHMWRLNDLLFSGGCPALVIDNCWDSNYTNIDVLGAGVTGGTNPAIGASLIVRDGSNNLYFRGLRIEAPVSGGIYVDQATAIRIMDGKIDNGFGPGQGASSITVTDSAELHVQEFYIGGQYTYQAHIAGAFICDRVTFDGGSGQPASIYDCRPWLHVDTKMVSGISRPSIGPAISRLDLGRSTFNRTHPSVNTTTPAAVYSKIYPIRALDHAGVTGNGAVHEGAITIATNAAIARNDQYTGCYLVHNPTGTRWDSRRKILSCFVGGQMTVAGTSPLPLDSAWSIEYCGGHYTPIMARDISLQSGASLFAQPFAVTITGTPIYDSLACYRWTNSAADWG